MTITEFAILPFKTPLPSSFSDDPTLYSLLQRLSEWQSECSGFPLRFFTDANDPGVTEPQPRLHLYLVTGWASVEAHDTWIRGERNQELLRVFAPYVDIPKVRMVHIDLEGIPDDSVGDGKKDRNADVWGIERYRDKSASSKVSASFLDTRNMSNGTIWSLVGKDMANDGDRYRFIGYAGGRDSGVGGIEIAAITPAEWWVLKKVAV